jgi:hypothetical protein
MVSLGAMDQTLAPFAFSNRSTAIICTSPEKQ